LEVRGNTVGDEEIRRLAAELLARAKADAPGLFSDFVEEELSDGSLIVYKQELPTEALIPSH
jgi:thymidylate synthase ThyX